MTSLCFANRAESLADIAKRTLGDEFEANLEERIRELEQLNPQLPKTGPIQTNNAILMPSDKPHLSSAEQLNIQ